MMNFSVRSDVVHAVRGNMTEDGEPLEGLVFYVIAETPNGTRYAHGRRYLNGETYRHPDGFTGFVRDKGEAEARAANLCAKITKAAKPLDPTCWEEIDPAYGSEAWQELDASGGMFGRSYFAERERIEDAEREGKSFDAFLGGA